MSLSGFFDGAVRSEFMLEPPRAPALDTAHLGVEVAFQRAFHRDKELEMRPAQLSPQRVDNLGAILCTVFLVLNSATPTARIWWCHPPPRRRAANIPEESEVLGVTLLGRLAPLLYW